MSGFCRKTCCWAVRRLPAFIVGLGVAILAFVAINAAMKPVSKSSYCGSKCHEMKPAYQA